MSPPNRKLSAKFFLLFARCSSFLASRLFSGVDPGDQALDRGDCTLTGDGLLGLCNRFGLLGFGDFTLSFGFGGVSSCITTSSSSQFWDLGVSSVRLVFSIIYGSSATSSIDSSDVSVFCYLASASCFSLSIFSCSSLAAFSRSNSCLTYSALRIILPRFL